jgi:hypothetical protein
MRILLTGLLAAGVLSLVNPAAHAASCRAALTTEAGASDIVGGHMDYTGTVVDSGLPATIAPDRIHGTVDGYLDVGGKLCSGITYTVVAYSEEPAPLVTGSPTLTEAARTTSYQVSPSNNRRLLFTFDIPEHSGECLRLQATTTNAAATVLDVAPEPEYRYVDVCVNATGGGGTQYWN